MCSFNIIKLLTQLPCSLKFCFFHCWGLNVVCFLVDTLVLFYLQNIASVYVLLGALCKLHNFVSHIHTLVFKVVMLLSLWLFFI